MIGRPLGRILAATMLVVASAGMVDAGTTYSQTVYRSSAFTTQSTSWHCTSAVVQNIRNLALGIDRAWPSEQRQMYAYGRSMNRHLYNTLGVDPQGVEAMLERYIPGTQWAVVRARSLQGALQIAARRMRATNLPAVLFVGGGRHVWTMNGYIASADPATAESFRVNHVRFSGPYYPKQQRLRGWFDLPPNTMRSVESLAYAFYPYKNRFAFGSVRYTMWNDYYVAVVPVAGGNPDPTPTPTPTPTTTTEPTPGTTTEPSSLPSVPPTEEPTESPTAGPTGLPTFGPLGEPSTSPSGLDPPT